MTRYPQQGQLAVPQLQAEASPQRASGLDLVQQCEAIGSIPSTPKPKQPSKHVPAEGAQQKGSTHACTEGHLGCLTCMITQARPTRAQRQRGSPVPMGCSWTFPLLSERFTAQHFPRCLPRSTWTTEFSLWCAEVWETWHHPVLQTQHPAVFLQGCCMN